MGELHAINKAIDVIIEDGMEKAAILTDCKNACLLIKQHTSHNYLVNNILKNKNSNITLLTFIWLPSYIGIEHNELADFLAISYGKNGKINTQIYQQ